MDIIRKELGTEVVFWISGSITGTLHSAGPFFESITVEIDKGGKAVVIDMSRLQFIDSLGVGLMIGLILKAKEKKVPLHLKHLPEHVIDVFDAANLKKAFPDLY